MRKLEVILFLIIVFLFGMITEAYLDYRASLPHPKPAVIQKHWEAPRTPFQGIQRV